MAQDCSSNQRVLSLDNRRPESFNRSKSGGSVMTLEILRRVAKRTLPEAALLPLKKIHYAKVLRSSTGSEEPELVALFGLISPGDYILDIGANFGRYTYHFSRLSG